MSNEIEMRVQATGQDSGAQAVDGDIPLSMRPALGSIVANPMQRAAIPIVLRGGRNLVLCCPTGSGKTLLAEIALLKCVNEGRLGLYLAPMKSIASEKREDWQRIERAGIRVYKSTGDDDAFDHRRALESDILITTPERADGILRSPAAETLIARLGLIVVDEVHSVSEGRRGSTLEAFLTRLQLQAQGVRLLAMSGTISNADEIALWLNDAELFRSTWRAVPLVAEVLPYTPSGRRQDDDILRDTLASREAGLTLKEGGAVLIFCGSRKGAESCAEALARTLRQPRPEMEDVLPSIVTPALRCCLDRGVGYHHAGLTPAEKHAVELLYRRGDVRIVVATTTVAAGVNLPARTVIVRDLTVGLDPISSSVLLQMAGRAGRFGLETQGRCIVIAPDDQVRTVRQMLDGEPVISRLGDDLATHLNTAIAVGTTTTPLQVKNWLSQTLWGVQRGRGADAAERQTRLDRELQTLARDGFIDSVNGALQTTQLGQSTSRFMLSVSSARNIESVSVQMALPSDADVAEEMLLSSAIMASTEWGAELDRIATSDLREKATSYNRRYLRYQEGQIALLAVVLALLGGKPVDALDLDGGRQITALARQELPRVLRFLARRALDRSPARPFVAVMAADLAAALEYGVADRGAAPVLQGLRQCFRPDESRRRLVLDSYSAWRAGAPLPHRAKSFLARRPTLQDLVQVVEDKGDVVLTLNNLPPQSVIYALVQTPVRQSLWCDSAPSGRHVISTRTERKGQPGLSVDVIVVPQHPLLWAFERFPLPSSVSAASPPSSRPATGRGDDWLVLRRFTPESVEPRRPPLLRHILSSHSRPQSNITARCPKCGGAMVERTGRTGPFLGCRSFPRCNGTRPL